MPKIFICYRRADSEDLAGRIAERLREKFGNRNIFFDINSIPSGGYVGKIIEENLAKVDIVLVLIGAQWLTISANGRRRLDDPADYVRREIEFSLQCCEGVRIIPVLLKNVPMPARADLPPSIQALSDISGSVVRSGRDFDRDMDDLILEIQRGHRRSVPMMLIGGLIAIALLVVATLFLANSSLNLVNNTSHSLIVTPMGEILLTDVPDPLWIFGQIQTREAEATLTAQPTPTWMSKVDFQATLDVIATGTRAAIQTVNAEITPTPDVLQLAHNFSGSNDDWTPIERDFNGVPMVLVPVGCFDMGENGEGGRQCFDQPFWIGKTEVTNSQYQEFIDAGGYANDAYWTTAGRDWRNANSVIQSRYWMNSNYNSSDQPVVGVSWYEAMAYAAWFGGRLPTEREWEYAARGVDGLIYPWGNTFDGTLLNYCDLNCELDPKDTNVDDGFAGVAPVGSYPSGVSWVDALDMSGNVWEWVNTAYIGYPYNANDGREDINGASSRVLRGSSWNFGDSYRARSVFRNYDSPSNRFFSVGFRVVLCPPPSSEC